MAIPIAERAPPAAERTDGQTDLLVDRALSRATGASLVGGNRVSILRDAAENYPAWLRAIGDATSSIRFEQYLIRDDAVGRRFADALLERAAAGVRVRLIYDWFGSLGTAGSSFWNRLRDGGIAVLEMAPPRLQHPFAWVRRDHRKSLVVDDRIAFVSGLCVAEAWEGDALRGVAPWRDTGLSLEGPAVVAVAAAFDAMWTAGTGEASPSALPPDPVGDVAVRVIASAPRGSGLFRLDQLIAAAATTRLWLSDAYYVGTAPYVQALRAAARDGVDVRLLVPNAGDVSWLRPLSRAGYRPLLDAGVRVFEWNGSMLHAKTAVADSRWCRIGSTNLNLASWLGNWELDVAVEDERIAAIMATHFMSDLESATEIVLRRARWGSRRVLPAAMDSANTTSAVMSDVVDELSPVSVAQAGGQKLRDVDSRKLFSRKRLPRVNKCTRGRAAAGALRIGNAVGAALLDRRLLGPAEARVDFAVAVGGMVLAAVAVIWPRLLTWPLAILGAWVGIASLRRAVISFRRERRHARETPAPHDG